MKKKPSKRSTGKAKPPRPRDAQLMIEFPERDKRRPPPTRQEIEARRERIARRLARDEARRQEFRARVARPPADMQRDRYRLPDDVASFLRRLHDEPRFYSDQQHIGIEEVKELVEAAYMEGCRQGFIEGFTTRREPDRKRSATGNAGKRKAIVKVGKVTMTRDERDELMAAEYSQLVTMMKSTPAYQRLAGKYDYESWQGVAAAIKAIQKRQSQ